MKYPFVSLFACIICIAFTLNTSAQGVYQSPPILSSAKTTSIAPSGNYLLIPNIALAGNTTTPFGKSIYELMPDWSLRPIYVETYKMLTGNKFIRFNAGYSSTCDCWYDYTWGPGHAGNVMLKASADAPWDTITPALLGYDQIRPHVFGAINTTMGYVITQDLVPADTTIFPSIPYYSNDGDTVTAQTVMRNEYLVLFDLATKQVLWEQPLWMMPELSDYDFRQYNGNITTWLGLHINATDHFVDTNGDVFGVNDDTVFVLSSKTMNTLVFVSKATGNNLILNKDINFSPFFYQENHLKVWQPYSIHGWKILDFSLGVLQIEGLNNGLKPNDIGEAVVLNIDFSTGTPTFQKLWAETHPDSLGSDRLGNVQTFSSGMLRLANMSGSAVNGVDFMIFDAFTGDLYADYDFQQPGDEAFVMNILSTAEVADYLMAQPEVTIDGDTLRAESGFSYYVTPSGDTLQKGNVALPVEDSLRSFGVPFAEGLVIGYPEIPSAINHQALYSQKMMVVPNPIVSFVKVVVDYPSTYSITLTTLEGKVIQRIEDINKREVYINLAKAKLAPGLYVISAEDVNGKVFAQTTVFSH